MGGGKAASRRSSGELYEARQEKMWANTKMEAGDRDKKMQ